MLDKFFLLSVISFSFCLPNVAISENHDWPAYGKSTGGGNFSSATQINLRNVDSLEQVWVHRSGDFHKGNKWTEAKVIDSSLQTSFQATPIVVEDTLFYCSPYNKVIALNPATGEEKWVFDPEIDPEGKGILHCRGVSSWEDQLLPKSDPCQHRIISTTIESELLSIDARTGRLCESFGDNGRVNLRIGLGDHAPGLYYSTSPPAIIDDLIIVGGSVADNVSIDVPGGVVRAYDARSGKLVWYWDPIHPDQKPVLHPDGSERYQRGTTNVWSIISVDSELGQIYLPTGNTSPDNYGGHRNGSDYYSSSVVSLDVKTGKVLWHFQTVHHDVWDYDVPSQPTFYEVEKNGKKIKALAQTTKMGFVFLLNRENGEPIFPIEERSVPQGPVEGDYLSPTQPFPTKPKPLTPTNFDPRNAYGFTFLDRGYCKRASSELRNEGLYTPPSLQGSMHYPSSIGGANWGGPAVDSTRNILVVNTMNLASTIKMIPRADCGKAIKDLANDRVQGAMSAIEENSGTPYCTLRAYGLMSRLGIPCTRPPWGALTGIDLVTGDHLWQVPLGSSKDLAPFPFTRIKGAPNVGGPMVTASGITFIAATSDYYLRAFNTVTGEELAKYRLPTGGHAVPMSYTGNDGKQFVVIAAGGHWAMGSPAGDYLVAFALPETE